MTPVGLDTPEFTGSVHVSGEPNQDVFDANTLTWAGSARALDTYYIAAMILTTSALITDIPQQQSAPADDMGDM